MKRTFSFMLVMTMYFAVVLSVTGQTGQRPAPSLVNLQEVSFRMISHTFITELDASNATYKMTQPDEYRGIVVTVEVKKPAGKALTLYMQDFCVHYNYGESDSDISPCKGISAFSTSQDVDRPMTLRNTHRGSSATGTSTTAASTLYIDFFFDYFEPTTKDLYLFVGQPCTQPYYTNGWSK
ncbi:MAG TPA: hypothetical protein VGB38_00975 [bacterium]